mmetsp:Transcript_15673/g.31838  ORF Transcript_15673/g.31838 Transcript_15673/m.31838 type:complete len:252 (-) Transcript_15673:276-1031(-)|eukprot:CAMPEP_0167791512 /NCGR_PEP_ID=MMETSP0111_2-20121227/11985_1 /TAXON_ID=91324 /ORGANISM="Lotharella globosa, Strain CCCM811" /LENGTH=251 /DNA_ID=CAMNT_0007684205 /DNA_START=80 /DNA_END=835 /DNA_ORIENTATION=-
MLEDQSVVVALFIVAATTYFIFRKYYRGRSHSDDSDDTWPFPKLQDHGIFPYPQGEQSALDERKSDFCRIAWTMTDLLVATPEAPIPEVWKYPGFGKKKESAHREEAEHMFQNLDKWVRDEIKQVDGETSKGLAARMVELLSVSPAITFAMEHNIPLQILQAKYMVTVSRSAQVRILWYAFITDEVKAGAKSGPYVLKLLSHDLNQAEADSSLLYTARRTRETQMCAITAKATEAIRNAILKDEWEALEAL